MLQYVRCIKTVSKVFLNSIQRFGKRTCSSASGSNGGYISHVKEIAIPMPYGKIAAKAWGNENAYPVLALHGWLDNCGTFDKLIPLLTKEFYIVAVDTPGHGLSSQRPPGSLYTDLELIVDFKRVIDYFGWKKCSLIGHSLGGCFGLMFACIFPDVIQKLVVLDIVKPTSRDITLFPSEITNGITNYLKNESKMSKEPPLYTNESAALRLKEGMVNEVTLESAKILNQRGTRKYGNGVVFNRDLRCRTIENISRRSHEVMKQFMHAVRCELLMIMANNTHPHYKSATPEVIDQFLDIYRENCKKFVLKYVDGNHFVHLNNPERVSSD
ncbi:putative serine hydrolase, partial [Stegodyphus mimosarum]